MTHAQARASLARAAFSVCVLALLSGAGGIAGIGGPASAQEAASAVQDVTLSDVALPLGDTLLRAPNATVSGTRLSKDELMAILKADSPEPWPARLARLEAASITIPVLSSEHAGAGKSVQTVSYRDVNARDVRAGRIAELTAASAAIAVSGGPRVGAGTYGRIAAADLDLAALARLYGTSGDGKGPVQRVYASVQVADVLFTDPDGLTVKFARIEGRDLGGRQVSGGWNGAVDALVSGLDAADPEMPAADRAKLAGTAADLVEAFSVGSLELRGFSLSQTDTDGPLLVEIERMAYAGAGAEAGTTLEGLAFAQGDLKARLGRLSLAGISLAPTIATLRRLANPDAVVSDDDLRRLAPAVAGLTVQNLGIDMPGDDAAPARDAGKPVGKQAAGAAKDASRNAGKSGDPLGVPGTPAPLHVGLRNAALTFGPPREGVPTASRLDLAGLTLPASLVAGMPVLGALPAYGYADLDLNLVADAAWDEAKREVAVRELTLSGRDMGSVRLAGTLGGFGPEIFTATVPATSLLMLSATAKAVDLTIQNTGLFERFLAAQSKVLSLKPEELRQEYVTATTLGVPAILGNSTAAQAIGAAMGRFVVKPGRLVVTVKAKNANGLGFVDFGTARSPAAILDKLDVDARAE